MKKFLRRCLLGSGHQWWTLCFILIILLATFWIREKWRSGTLSADDTSNMLGLNSRESFLAVRLRDLQEQYHLLERQLSASQNQLMSLAAVRPQAKRLRGLDDEDEDVGDQEDENADENASPCKGQVLPVPQCEVIHVSVVCAGIDTARAVATLVKSLLFYRKNPVHFHLVVDQIAQEILEKLFSTWRIKQVQVSFYATSQVEDLVSWVPNKHYSGVFGLLKLTLPDLLPKDLSRVIVLDTDVSLATDIAGLWREFGRFPEKACLGLVENQSDWYLGKLWKTHHSWPAMGRGFNTGVILMNLDRLRGRNWHQLWRSVAEKNLVTLFSTSLADQDIFNAVIKEHPDMIHQLPCQWNLQMSDNTRADLCYSSHSVRNLNLIHFNSPKKLNVRNAKAQLFRNQYLAFQQYDGNLLRRELVGCEENVENENLNNEFSNEGEDGEECFELRRAKDIIYRTHLYFLPHQLKPTNEVDDVTLAAQLSMDRLHMIELLCAQWSGPISMALYLSDSEAQQLVHFVQGSKILAARDNVGYHVVYKEGGFYPVNFLRNVALENVLTPFVFLSDIDFLPGSDVYATLRKSVQDVGLIGGRKDVALVVPAFETQRYRLSEFPRTKAEVVDLLDLGTLLTFRYHIWPQGHKATNYGKWRTSTKPYRVLWEPDFEPYLVVSSDVPRYDQRFLGFGWNKVSHIMELKAQKFEFLVLPNVFIIHMPHAPSLDIARFRSSEEHRRNVVH